MTHTASSANPIQKAQEAAQALRLGMEGQASAALTLCIDALLSRLQNQTLQVTQGNFLQVLEQIIAAQQRNDPIYLADLLEYELVPILRANS